MASDLITPTVNTQDGNNSESRTVPIGKKHTIKNHRSRLHLRNFSLKSKKDDDKDNEQAVTEEQPPDPNKLQVDKSHFWSRGRHKSNDTEVKDSNDKEDQQPIATKSTTKKWTSPHRFSGIAHIRIRSPHRKASAQSIKVILPTKEVGLFDELNESQDHQQNSSGSSVANSLVDSRMSSVSSDAKTMKLEKLSLGTDISDKSRMSSWGNLKRRTKSFLLLDPASVQVTRQEDDSTKSSKSSVKKIDSVNKTTSWSKGWSGKSHKVTVVDSNSSTGSDTVCDDDNSSISPNASTHGDSADDSSSSEISTRHKSLSKKDEPKPSVNSRERSKTLGSYSRNVSGASGSKFFNSVANLVKPRKLNVETPETSSDTTSESSVTIEPSKDDLPEYNDETTPSSYLDVLLASFSCIVVAHMLSLQDNEFYKQVLRVYFDRYFDFTDKPLDIALREFLMLNELPKEEQQIDRLIYEFGRHYSMQHPEFGMSVDNCYILTYALLMLHTDRFNPSNKHKMARFEFINNLVPSLNKNASICAEFGINPRKAGKNSLNLVLKELLGYLYDNITYEEFSIIKKDQAIVALEAMIDPLHKIPYPIPTRPSMKYFGESPSYSAGRNVSSSSLLKRGSLLWSQPNLEVYDYICKHTIEKLKLDLKFHFINPFINTSNKKEDKTAALGPTPSLKYIDEQVSMSLDDINADILRKVISSVTDASCSVILKVPKAKGEFLRVPNSQTLSYGILSEMDDAGEEFYIVRVVKFGMLARHDSKVKAGIKAWKRYFCLLTPIGIFFFKSLSLFRMSYHMGDVGKKTIIFEEKPTNSATTNLLESFSPSISIHWNACAIRMRKNNDMDKAVNQSNGSTSEVDDPLRRYTFCIYTRNSKSTYMVDNLFELKSWVTQINYIAALASIAIPVKKLDLFKSIDEEKLTDTDDIGGYPSETSIASNIQSSVLDNRTRNTSEENIETEEAVELRYTEITYSGILNISSRLEELDMIIKNAKETLLGYIISAKRLAILTPLQYKTKEELLSSAKILNAKMEWLWYELTRDTGYCVILRYLEKNRDYMQV